MLGHIPAGTHMCLIYSSKAEVMQELADFLTQSIKDGGIAHYFHMENKPDAVLDKVRACGCDDHAIDGGVSLHSALSVYAPDGAFDKDQMLETLTGTYLDDRQTHSGSIHYTGEMEWALDPEIQHREQVIAYEQAVNEVCKTHPFSAICQYDANKFDPDFLFKVMQAHPFLLVDGMITPSPLYQEGR